MPLLLPAIGWLLGLVLARLDAVSLLMLQAALLLNLMLLLYWRKPWLMTCLFGLIYGLSSLIWDMQHIQIEPSWLNNKQHISATIDSIRPSKTSTRLRLKHILREDGSSLAGKIDVYLYAHKQVFQAGMRISTLVKLHLPHNKQNPAFFDYEKYCFTQHIAAIGSISGKVVVLDANISWLEQARQHIRHALAPLDHAEQGILSALLLADRSLIPLAIDDAFAASGATHLLAISGLHVGLVAGWGFMLCWWLLTRREDWIVLLPIRTVALSMGVVLAMAYATLAAWPIPAQRASLMLFAAVLAWWFRASQVPLNTMLAALILITLFDPAAVLAVSLWLSFAATTSLLIWAGSQQQQGESIFNKALFWFKGMFWVSILASLATLPLIGLIFERLPTWSLLANALLVPLYALWVLPLALLGELCALLGFNSIATAIFQLSATAITWGNDILLTIYTFPAGNLWLRADKPMYPALLALFLSISGYLWLKKHKTWSCALLSVTLIAYSSLMLTEQHTDTAQLHVWDVGQGASALLQLPHFNLLVDAPGKKGSKFNGGSIAASNARALGLLHLDAVALTHAQSDHAGGVLRLLASLNGVKELWLADVPDNHHYHTMKAAIKQLKAQGGKVRWLQQGDVIDLADGSHIEVLWPPKGYQPSNGNNTSLVLAITLSTGQRLLLPGDMQKQVERKITPDLQAFDVLLMPHHGSKTSSTPAFVQATRPSIVIAQTGFENHYGFPKKEVVARYQNVGSQWFDTAHGAVSLSFSANHIAIRQFQSNLNITEFSNMQVAISSR